jgi:hypothetical protein
VSVCRSCGADIEWVVSDHGKRIPLDPTPVVGGNIEIDLPENVESDPPRARYVTPSETVARYQSHFATCPDAKTWRR